MRIIRFVCVTAAVAGLAGFSNMAAADAAAGKAKFTAECAECHEVGDFADQDAKALTDTVKKIVAGSQKHKKALKLSDAEIADLAAYMAAGK